MFLLANTNLISRSLLCLLALLATASSARADLFVDIPGVPGQATENAHRNWIRCESAAFGIVRAPAPATAATRRTASGPRFSEITLVRTVDVSSPELFYRAASGDAAPSVVMEFTRSAGDAKSVYLVIELKEVRVTSYSIAASEETDTEQVTLSFSEITMRYTAFDDAGRPAGTTERSWNVNESRKE